MKTLKDFKNRLQNTLEQNRDILISNKLKNTQSIRKIDKIYSNGFYTMSEDGRRIFCDFQKRKYMDFEENKAHFLTWMSNDTVVPISTFPGDNWLTIEFL